MPTLIRTRPTLEVSVDFAANPTATYADIHETDDGLVSFWRCNSTSTFLDELGANDGVLISTPTTTAGPYPYDSDLATTFDGANDSAYVESSGTLAFNVPISVDGWLKVAALPAGTRDVVAKRGSWVFQLTAAGKIIFATKNDTGGATVTSNTTIAVNTWYHITGVNTGAMHLLYINGVLDTSIVDTEGMELVAQPVRFAGSLDVTAPSAIDATALAGGPGTTITGTKPGSTASGHLLIAHVTGHSATTPPTVTTVPTGWAQIDARIPGANTFSHMYYKIAGGAEPASYSWGTDISVGYTIGILLVSGYDTTAPFANLAYGAAQTTLVAAHSSGAHSANMTNSLRLDFFYSRGVTSFTYSSGTEIWDFNSVANNTAALAQQIPTVDTSVNNTGTAAGAQIGAAHTLHVAGTGITELACTLDDWAVWTRALDADDVARNYYAKDSGTPTWTAVTTEVRELETSLPERRHELDTLVVGKMGMTLREVNDKDFDPGNTSSPYGPDVEQRVRVRATWNAVTYDVFRGYADRWTPTRLGGADVEEVAFEATDGFDLLALAPVEGTVSVGFSGTQIGTILNKALWPLADRDLDTGQYVMNGFTIGEGTFGLSLLQEIAGSERGIFFIDAAGIATFHDAAHRGTQTRSTTSQATFADYISNIATSTDIRYQWIQPTRDKDKIVNVWTVSPDSGVFGAADQTMRDPISIAKYGLRGSSRSTRLATNADALDQAGNLLNDTAYPSDRYESMKVIPLTTESYATCLGLTISDRVTVKRGFNPGWDGATMTRDYFVEGKQVTVADKTAAWQFVFVLSPVSSANYYGTIVRDDPISYWRNDSIT